MTTKSVEARNFLEKLYGPLTFGSLISSLRICDEISQVELARKVGIPRSHLCDIEKGRRSVSIERAVKFAKAMGYPTQSFITILLEDQLRSLGIKMKVHLEAA